MPIPDQRRLQELVDEPRETLDVEIKEWLDLGSKEHRATLAKEVIALANHGGGFLIVGFRETEEGRYSPAPNRPTDLSTWSQDKVQGVIARYLDPQVQCHVDHQSATADGQTYPVITVPGGQRVPVFAKKGAPGNGDLQPNRVYIRRAGPNSEEPRTTDEWHQLFERIVKNRQAELTDIFRTLLSGEIPVGSTPIGSIAEEPTRDDNLLRFIENAESRWTKLVQPLPKENGARFPQGFYDFAFAVDADFDPKTLPELKDIVQTAVKNHSGWPPFLTISRPPVAPSPVDGTVETWLGRDDVGPYDDPPHQDFWRVSPEGLMFTRRGYSEDGTGGALQPGTTFDITTPTWRLGEAIVNAAHIARKLLGSDADLICYGRWTGLKGRELVSRGNPNRMLFDGHRAEQNEFQIETRVALSAVETSLPEVVHGMLEPLYVLFDFFVLPKRLVEEELDRLLRNRY